MLCKDWGWRKITLWTLTFAPILVKVSDSASVIDEGPVIDKEGGWSIRQRPVVKMIQSAVVLSTIGRSQIEVGSAQELSFNLASSLTRSSTVGHQLFVSVEVDIDMQRNLLFRNSDSWTWKWSFILARTVRVQTQVFKIVNACDKTMFMVGTFVRNFLPWASTKSMGLKSSTGVLRS